MLKIHLMIQQTKVTTHKLPQNTKLPATLANIFENEMINTFIASKNFGKYINLLCSAQTHVCTYKHVRESYQLVRLD